MVRADLLYPIGSGGMTFIPLTIGIICQLQATEPLEKLAAPTISLDGDNLIIESNDGRETSYDIYVDGVFVVNIPAKTYDYEQEGSIVTLSNAPYSQEGSEVTIQ